LFGNDEGAGDPKTRARTARFQQSILDLVADDTRKLQAGLGKTDQRKLDEYFTAIREVERQVQMMEKQIATSSVAAPSMMKPDGVPIEFAEHARLMFDLLTIALQTDTTRISTFMLAREGSNRSYREIGIPEGHHGLSHHRNDPSLMDKVATINQHHMEQTAYFLQKLKKTKDGTGSLLDNTIITYGSGISDGNKHNHDDLPVMVAGGSRVFKTGRHIRYQQSQPVANLYLSILDAANVPTDKFADSQNRLNYLSSLT
jgi:hypothetical protein